MEKQSPQAGNVTRMLPIFRQIDEVKHELYKMRRIQDVVRTFRLRDDIIILE